METVDTVIRSRLNSDVVLIRTIGEYIIGAGGKRMRPVLLLLIAQALGYKGTHHHLMAAAVEFIHTATLLHDDVVDESHRSGRRRSLAEQSLASQMLSPVLALPLPVLLHGGLDLRWISSRQRVATVHCIYPIARMLLNS
jgi:hypothetical protein